MKKILFFDLDGTLTDPGVGITNSVAYALRKFGIEVPEREKLYSFIGPPLYDSFREHFGLSHEDAELAIDYYREYFAPKGKLENTVYDGIPELLSELREAGKTLVVATSKPEKFALEILEHFDLLKYFDRVYGATMDEKRNKKDAVIAYALEEMKLSSDDVVMIGDRKYDIEGAHKNSMEAVGVLWGYGDRKELESENAEYIAADVAELKNSLTK